MELGKLAVYDFFFEKNVEIKTELKCTVNVTIS